MRKPSTIFYLVSLTHSASLFLYLLLFEEVRNNIFIVSIAVLVIVPILMLLNALISNNGNGNRLTKKEALAVIAKGSGTFYVPYLVDILLGFNKDNDK